MKDCVCAQCLQLLVISVLQWDSNLLVEVWLCTGLMARLDRQIYKPACSDQRITWIFFPFKKKKKSENLHFFVDGVQFTGSRNLDMNILQI